MDYKKLIGERLEEVWVPVTAMPVSEQIQYLEQLKRDERLDAGQRATIEKRIQDLQEGV